MAKATANPYDRREQEKRRGATPSEWGEVNVEHFDILADGRRAYPGFQVSQLEALLRDEFARGFNTGEGTHEALMEEKLAQIKRRVWNEGHAAGRAELLLEIDAQFGGTASRAADRFEELVDGSPKPDELSAALDDARKLLRALIHAHHSGFAAELPF